MRWSLSVTRNIAGIAGDEYMENIVNIVNIVNGVKQDIPIWTNKIHRESPVFCETDKCIAEFRKWTRRFYSEVVVAE